MGSTENDVLGLSNDVAPEYRIGKRYLNSKTGQPLTVRYIGPLPPSSISSTPTWLGVEYDDPSHGKHSGSYQGVEIFKCRNTGAGSFLRYSKGILLPGKTFVQAIHERYSNSTGEDKDTLIGEDESSRVVLGSSKDEIIVEAPGMAAVQARMGRLERLREIGLEGEWIFGLGAGRQDLVKRLVGLRMLNLSRNLFSSWEDVAEIVKDMPNLRYLSLNFSRLTPLQPNEEDIHLQEAFKRIEQLHLGESGVTWREVCSVGRMFANVHTLNLGYNRSFGTLSPALEWSNLKEISLEGCHIERWDEIANSVGRLPLLDTLNLSATIPLSSVTVPPEDNAERFPRLHTLIWLNTSVTSWVSIGALECWTKGRLHRLRLSLNGIDDTRDESTVDLPSSFDSSQMTGRAKLDRPFLIAKLSGLVSLNSTPITPAERRDAEAYYVRQISSLSSGGDSFTTWGRYEVLKGIYDATTEVPSVKPTSLRSKMITLHIYPAQHKAFDLSVLPSSPTILLRRKVAKTCGVSPGAVRIWTTRGEDRELVMEVDDGEGKEAGWWFRDGDDVVVDTG